MYLGRWGHIPVDLIRLLRLHSVYMKPRWYLRSGQICAAFIFTKQKDDRAWSQVTKMAARLTVNAGIWLSKQDNPKITCMHPEIFLKLRSTFAVIKVLQYASMLLCTYFLFVCYIFVWRRARRNLQSNQIHPWVWCLYNETFIQPTSIRHSLVPANRDVP